MGLTFGFLSFILMKSSPAAFGQISLVMWIIGQYFLWAVI